MALFIFLLKYKIKPTTTPAIKINNKQYYEDKFGQIDSGISHKKYHISTVNKTPVSPTNLTLNTYFVSSVSQVIHYSFLVSNYNYINNYRIRQMI
jgi:hypothetical protein